MRFLSKFKKHYIGLVPSRYVVDQYGVRTLVRGKFAQFENNEFETEDKEIIKLIQQHPAYRVDFWSPDDMQTENKQAKAIIDAENSSADDALTSCPHCPFNAQTNFGLKAHMRLKHKQEN